VKLSPTKIFNQLLHYHESPKFLLSLIKQQLPLAARTQSQCDVYTLHASLRQWPLNITKNNYRVCLSGDIETKRRLFIHCNYHCTARAALHVNVRGILTKCGLAERFECLSHVDLSCRSCFSCSFCAVDHFVETEIDSDCTRYNRLMFFLYASVGFLLFLCCFTFPKLDVTQQSCTIPLQDCC